MGTAADIAHEALFIGVDLLDLAPVPGLRPAAQLLLNIWDVYEESAMALRPRFPAGLLQSKRPYIIDTHDHSQLIPDMKSIVIRRLALVSSQTSTKVHVILFFIPFSLFSTN